MSFRKKCKGFLKKAASFCLNPHFLLCFVLGWVLTNGWAYAALALGLLLRWPWLTGVASAYLTFLWVPGTPEKLVTLALAMWLLKRLYPDDQKTLAVLHSLREKLRKKQEKD